MTFVSKFLKTRTDAKLFYQEQLKLSVGEALARAMKAKSITKRTLARRTGFSTGYIRALLEGSVTPTLDDISYLFVAMDLFIHIRVKPFKLNEL